MNLPASFLLGIGVLVVYEQIHEPLPGRQDLGWWTVWPYLISLALPAIAANFIRRRVETDVRRRNTLTRRAFELLRIPGLLVPVVYGGWVFGAGYAEIAQQLAPSSSFLQHALLLAPLMAMEFSVRVAESSTVRFLEFKPGLSLTSIGPRRLSMTLFVIAPILAFSLLADVAFAERRLEVFVDGTALGSSLGILVMAIALCVGLPMFFRWTQPTSTRLPIHIAKEIQETAKELGFRPDKVLVLHTGRRIVNAAMVGPLPWPRYLVLSDGILALLDRSALRGVIAHEVGHARAHHPLLLMVLFVVIPVLLLHPILVVDLEAIDSTVLIAVGGVLTFLTIVILRRIAHQFEFEADRLSAEALGDAGPCIDALTRVGEMDPGHRTRSSFRHPSEVARVAKLLEWAHDEGDSRARATHRSRRLRHIVLGLAASALIVSAIVHTRLWPYDHAVYALYTGDIRSAQTRVDDLQPDPPFVTKTELAALRREIDAAFELVGPGAPDSWDDLNSTLADRAWSRALSALVSGSADSPVAAPQLEAASPWISLALADPPTDALTLSVVLWVRALEEGRTDRARDLAAHIVSLDPPPALATRLRASLAAAAD